MSDLDKEYAREQYERHKAGVTERKRRISSAARDIGDPPDVVDQDRKDACRRDFQAFCEAYFPASFQMGWSPDHKRVLLKTEAAVLHGRLFAMAMPRGSGKGLSLDTPIPTPSGFVPMGEIQVGDIVFGSDGFGCEVTHVSEIHNIDCYRVEFSDGSYLIADCEHRWKVEDIWSRKNPLVLTTEEMKDRVVLPTNRPGRTEYRYRIANAEPVVGHNAGLPIDPYTLGVWLGDGAKSQSSVTLHRDDAVHIIEKIRHPWSFTCEERGYCDRFSLKISQELRSLNLLDNKHIPREYLTASVEQRMELLRGLLDTDGHNANGNCELTLLKGLAEDACDLLCSLGFKIGVRERFVEFDGKNHGPYLRISFTAFEDFNPFSLPRKAEQSKRRSRSRSLASGKRIVSITPVDSVPTRCIAVNSDDNTYLAGRRYTVTHNTTIAETAVIWSALYGHRKFPLIIGSDETAANELLDSIKSEIEYNELLAEDFPEVTYPIQCLEGIQRRAEGQTCNGDRTLISLNAKEIVLPTIAGSDASGVVIRCRGLTGRLRGMKFKRPDGESVRPDLVVVDDPQTDQSARSVTQVATRMNLLSGAVLNLAGPGRKIAGIVPCTVIAENDVAHQLLDRESNPEFNGELAKMIYEFPTDKELWEQYRDIREDSLREHGDIREATKFYTENRKAMDAGSRVGWEERFEEDEVSALQHAMNKMFRDEESFFAEMQNEPIDSSKTDNSTLSHKEICDRTDSFVHCQVPVEATKLTAFIDVQGQALYYCVLASGKGFTSHVIDYGTFPDQKRRTFTLAKLRHSLEKATKKKTMEGMIYAGLEMLTAELFGHPWMDENEIEHKIDLCLIDANWGMSTDTVYQFCRKSAFPVMPSHGIYVGASSQPMTESKRAKGEKVGLNWRVQPSQNRRTRCIRYDTNFWKSFMHQRLNADFGSRGALYLYDTDNNFREHDQFANHLLAEYAVRTEGRGRIVDEWKIRPQRYDNHWLDCLAGCLVAASVEGIGLKESGNGAPLAKRRVAKLPGRS